MSQINFLAEDRAYKVYALEESIYLKRKSHCHKQNDYEEQDLCIGWHYGNPSSAIILVDYIIIAGCGLTIFELEKQKEEAFFNEPGSINWTNGLHQNEMDGISEFRYVALTEDEKLGVFKMNALSKEVTLLN